MQGYGPSSSLSGLQTITDGRSQQASTDARNLMPRKPTTGGNPVAVASGWFARPVLPRNCHHALRMCLHLVYMPPGELCRVHVLAAELGLPAAHLRKVASELVKGGLLESSRGRKGGVTLARAPSAITLLAIMEVLGGIPAPRRCLLDLPKCTPRSPCPMDLQLSKDHREAVRLFGTWTLASFTAKLSSPRPHTKSCPSQTLPR